MSKEIIKVNSKMVVKEAEITDEIMESVIDDITATITENVYNSRITLVKMKWLIGNTLRKTQENFNINISELVLKVAKDNALEGKACGDRELWFCLSFYDAFPADDFDLVENKLPEGKNVSVSKIKKLLCKPRAKVEPTIEEIAERIFVKMGDKTQELINQLQKLVDLVKKGNEKTN
jgi:hypothetical protein